MSSDPDCTGSFGTPSDDDDQGITRAVAEQILTDLLQRGSGSAGELLPTELVSQILSLIQQGVASAKHEATSITDDTTPGLEGMGWALWEAVDVLSREDKRHHDALIAFINASSRFCTRSRGPSGAVPCRTPISSSAPRFESPCKELGRAMHLTSSGGGSTACATIAASWHG